MACDVWLRCAVMQEEAVPQGAAERADGAPGEAPPRDCTGACCHGGAKMAVLAYSLGKREINQHFTIKNAKLISIALVVLLLVFHTASRYYGGECSHVYFTRIDAASEHKLLLMLAS